MVEIHKNKIFNNLILKSGRVRVIFTSIVDGKIVFIIHLIYLFFQ